MKRSDAELLARLREKLEALWDCTCTQGAACERCVTLAEVDAALAANPPNGGGGDGPIRRS